MVIGCACQRGAGLGDTGIQRSQIAQRRVEAASRSRSARKRSVVVISGLLWHHRNYIRHFRSITVESGTPLKLNDYLSRSSGMAKALAIFGASRIIILMGIAFSANVLMEDPMPGVWNTQAPWWGRYLLRFDSGYYPDIASTGYAYNGNPLQMQSIVFFPG